MRHPDYAWVDVAFGGVERRNNLVPVNQARPPANTQDCYRTVYRYPAAMKEHFDKEKSVRGYGGMVYADWLPVDIDDEEDITRSHDHARVFLMQLEVRYDVNLAQVWCFFSGQKGFHILLPQVFIGWEPSIDLPRRFRDTALMLADGLPIDTSIYDRVRLLRLTNTRHSKSGLHKIPLYASEVLNWDTADVLVLAKETRQAVEWEATEPSEALQALWSTTAKAQEKPTVRGAGKLDRWAKPCIAKMLEGGLKQGKRQSVAFRLAVHFRKQGMGGPLIQAALREWNSTNIVQLEDRELGHAVEQAVTGEYDHGCNDPILQEYCGGACWFKGQQEQEAAEAPKPVGIIDIREAQRRYEQYVSLLRVAKVTLGVPKLDDAMRGIAPGEACWLIARAGVGKTALLLNILVHNSRQGADSLFCTLEQPVEQIYERATQMSVQVTGSDVEQLYLRAVLAKETGGAVPEQYERWADNTAAAFSLVRFADGDSMGIQEVEAAVLAYEATYGNRPRIIGIDYLGRMDGGYGSPYEQTSRLAKQVKSIAKKLSLAVIVIHQVSREGGDGTQEVALNMARDSGQVEEAADFVIGLWRPDMKEAVREKREVESVKAALLKCRRGPLRQTSFAFHKAKMLFVPE